MKPSGCPWLRKSLVLADRRGKPTAIAAGGFSLALQTWGCVIGLGCGVEKPIGKPELFQ